MHPLCGMPQALSKYTFLRPHVKLSCGAVHGAAYDASCFYGCGPTRKPPRWPTSEPTIALHRRYYLPMACNGRAGIVHCPPPYHRWCQLPAHHKMAPGTAHFHVGGPRASTMICIVAPGPAWGESMSPADLFCWPSGLILLRCPLPEAMGRDGGCQAKTDGVSPPQTSVFRPVWPPDKPVAYSCDGRRAKTDGPRARNLTGPWAKTDGPGVPGVDPIA